MRRKLLPFCFLIFFISPCFAEPSLVKSQTTDRLISWNDVCLSVDYLTQREKVISAILDRQESSIDKERQTTPLSAPAQKINFPPPTVLTNPNVIKPDSSSKKAAVDHALNQFEMAMEITRFIYKEPGKMRQKGNMMGISGGYTWRTKENKPVKSFGEVFSDENGVNMFRLEAKYGWGKVDYNCDLFGVQGMKDQIAEVRGLVGLDIPLTGIRLTPYLGLGHRFLYNDARGETIVGDTIYVGYRRKSRYYYIPVGMMTQTKGNKTKLETMLEYDVFIHGQQTSYMGDYDPVLGEVTKDQSKGFGTRGSMKLSYMGDGVDLFFEPYVRYWSMHRSDVAITVSDERGQEGWVEPKNNSTEYGVKLGFNF